MRRCQRARNMPRARLTTIAELISAVAGAIAIMVSPIISNPLPLAITGGMRGDAGLTDRGREQAQLLEKRLREEELHADQLYASTLPRALETAQYVARALDLRVQPDDELHELRPGEADGLTLDQWRGRGPAPPPAAPAPLTPPPPRGGG